MTTIPYVEKVATIHWNEGKPEITTKQLKLRPITPDDMEAYKTLFCDELNMKMYGSGTPYNEKRLEARVKGWVARVELHKFSALAVIDRVSNKVIGHAVLGHGDYEGKDKISMGWSEAAFIIDKAYWNATMQMRN